MRLQRCAQGCSRQQHQQQQQQQQQALFGSNLGLSNSDCAQCAVLFHHKINPTASQKCV
jgi:hypothetical protein